MALSISNGKKGLILATLGGVCFAGGFGVINGVGAALIALGLWMGVYSIGYLCAESA